MRIIFGKSKKEKELEAKLVTLEDSYQQLLSVNKANTEKESENILRLNNEINKIKYIVSAYESVKTKRKSAKDYTVIITNQKYSLVRDVGKGNLDKLYKSLNSYMIK